MKEFDETDYNVTDSLYDNPSENTDKLIEESLDNIDEKYKTGEAIYKELFEQQEYDHNGIAFPKDTNNPEDILEQNYINYEEKSYEELVEEYSNVCSHDAVLGEQYVKYDKQIAEIYRDKYYYSSEKEWNDYIDEKILAQNEVSTRRNQIQSEMRKLETEMDKKLNN